MPRIGLCGSNRSPWKRFFEELVDIAASKFTNSEVAFNPVCPPDTGYFQVDTLALQSALVSIIENALDACRDDAAKVVHVVSLKIEPEADMVRLKVIDNGTGIDPEIRERMFTPFLFL